MDSKAAPDRSIRLLLPPTGEIPGVLSIIDKKNSSYYAFREIPCAIGGRGFATHRLGLGNLYYVRIGEPEECSCECLGFLRHGRCKHVLGLLALVRKGLL
jgi:hypothetical protein